MCQWFAAVEVTGTMDLQSSLDDAVEADVALRSQAGFGSGHGKPRAVFAARQPPRGSANP